MASAHSMGAGDACPGAGEVRDHVKRAMREAWTVMAGGWHGEEAHREGHGPRESRRRGPRFPFGFGEGQGWPGMPPRFPFGGGHRHGSRGRKAKRGDVRAAILALLSEEPRNGYQIIQEIAARSHGGWKPSPGAVYPALQQLADEGLVRSEESEGRKTFHLTEEGRAYVDANQQEMRAPWEEMAPDLDDPTWELIDLARQSGFAMFQIMQTGTPAQVRQAREVLIESRRKLYHILADGDPGDE
ncbi:PadR family transcriptional regulator [Sinosporangium siamense]|uniref:Transcription regulator PadR N-terminal domain-containing protein n=1 Tax=Sinosporangium siamense TaxID=1367973 RepID=A0A919RHE9_9ACTN|nr:PadR family transcriptional regulator [Sinosporangium siamense]GII92021.1 hypothetical protein Ssi02_22520 [Sinosporangium siamense]